MASGLTDELRVSSALMPVIPPSTLTISSLKSLLAAHHSRLTSVCSARPTPNPKPFLSGNHLFASLPG